MYTRITHGLFQAYTELCSCVDIAGAVKRPSSHPHTSDVARKRGVEENRLNKCRQWKVHTMTSAHRYIRTTSFHENILHKEVTHITYKNISYTENNTIPP